MITAGSRPAQLKCEYRIDPLGIDERAPRFSWVLESERRGQVQSAYRILVARSEEYLEAEENLLWDSGRVESDRTVGVKYEGEALRSSSHCVWKVRVWDGAGDPSSYGGSAVFEMGLLERSDWDGTWISAGKGPAGDMEPPSGEEYDDLGHALAPSPYLRKEFRMQKLVRWARLYATARGVYELYLNGNRVGNDVLAPGWTDYDSRVQYQTYDVTSLLVEGPNVLGAVLGDGWFAGFVGFDPKHRGAHYGARPQLLVQLDLEYEDGSRECIATDGSWRCSTGPILFSDLLMGESYDARKEMPGWAEPGFDDSGWYGVETGEIEDTNLVAQPDEGIRVTEELEAKTVSEPRDGVYIFDMGRNMVGRVRLRVEGEAGTEITLRHAEARHEDAREYRDLNENIKAAFNETYVFPDGQIEGDTQTCYLLALHMELLPEELRSAAAEHLVRTIEREDWHLSTGFVGVGYLCPVLTEAGYTAVAYRLLENETYPSWGYTVKNGATTIWERWDGWTEENGFQSPNMNSFNHYSLGSVGEWLYRYVAGIDLGAPGYGQIVIHPRPGGSLTHASAEYDSVRGRISSSWKIEGDRFVLEVLIPQHHGY